jgi:hypothetical protein
MGRPSSWKNLPDRFTNQGPSPVVHPPDEHRHSRVVQSILAARIDRLLPLHRRILHRRGHWP